MTEFFPGSNRPVTPPKGFRDIVPPAKLTVVLNGQEMEMFSISELAAALNRKPQTVRKWEREKIIPRATFVKPSKDPRGRRRLYSRAQVEAMVTIAESEGILYNLKANIGKTQFKQRVYQAFREIGAR